MGYLAELETNFRLGKLLMNLWIGSSNLVEKGLKDKGHLFRYAVLALERVHLRDTDPRPGLLGRRPSDPLVDARGVPEYSHVENCPEGLWSSSPATRCSGIANMSC